MSKDRKNKSGSESDKPEPTPEQQPEQITALAAPEPQPEGQPQPEPVVEAPAQSTAQVQPLTPDSPVGAAPPVAPPVMGGTIKANSVDSLDSVSREAYDGISEYLILMVGSEKEKDALRLIRATLDARLSNLAEIERQKAEAVKQQQIVDLKAAWESMPDAAKQVFGTLDKFLNAGVMSKLTVPAANVGAPRQPRQQNPSAPAGAQTEVYCKIADEILASNGGNLRGLPNAVSKEYLKRTGILINPSTIWTALDRGRPHYIPKNNAVATTIPPVAGGQS